MKKELEQLAEEARKIAAKYPKTEEGIKRGAEEFEEIATTKSIQLLPVKELRLFDIKNIKPLDVIKKLGIDIHKGIKVGGDFYNGKIDGLDIEAKVNYGVGKTQHERFITLIIKNHPISTNVGDYFGEQIIRGNLENNIWDIKTIGNGNVDFSRPIRTYFTQKSFQNLTGQSFTDFYNQAVGKNY